MQITVKPICGKYQEVEIELDGHTLNSGTLDAKEVVDLATDLACAATELLAGINWESL